jgi:hypothetical protein
LRLFPGTRNNIVDESWLWREEDDAKASGGTWLLLEVENTPDFNGI